MDTNGHPWARGGLTINTALLAQVDAEARAGYARDEESCGFLTGPLDVPMLVNGLLPMENRANKLHALDPVAYPRTGRMYFDIDALGFERQVRAQDAAGLPVKVLYHSHLDVGAYFSPTDAAAATLGGDEPAYPLAYLVTSVRGSGVGDTAAFVDDHKLFVWDGAKRSFVESAFAIAILPRGASSG